MKLGQKYSRPLTLLIDFPNLLIQTKDIQSSSDNERISLSQCVCVLGVMRKRAGVPWK